MPFVEDFDVFYITDEFATDATYTAVGGTHPDDGTAIKVIFDNRYFESNGMEGTRPTARCVETDVSDWSSGAQIRVSGNDYYIRDGEPNGNGEIMLILEAQ